MRLELMNRLNLAATYVFEELTYGAGDADVAKDFWRYLRSRLLDDMAKKVKVSEYVRWRVLQMDAAEFEKKYKTSLSNIKKSREQMDFLCLAAATLLHHSRFGDSMIDWT